MGEPTPPTDEQRTLVLRVCDTCPRTDRNSPLGLGSHYWQGHLCPGKVSSVEYIPAQEARRYREALERIASRDDGGRPICSDLCALDMIAVARGALSPAPDPEQEPA